MAWGDGLRKRHGACGVGLPSNDFFPPFLCEIQYIPVCKALAIYSLSLSFSRLCDSLFLFFALGVSLTCKHTHMQSQAEWRGHVFGRTSSERMWRSESLQQKQQQLSLSPSTRDVGVRLHYYQLWARPPHFIDTSCLPEPSKALFLKQTAAFQVPHWLFSLFWWIHLGLR